MPKSFRYQITLYDSQNGPSDSAGDSVLMTELPDFYCAIYDANSTLLHEEWLEPLDQEQDDWGPMRRARLRGDCLLSILPRGRMAYLYDRSGTLLDVTFYDLPTKDLGYAKIPPPETD